MSLRAKRSNPPFFPYFPDKIYGLRTILKKYSKKETYDLEKIVLEFYPQISFRVKKSVGYSNPEWEDICSEIVISVVEAIKSGKFRGDSSIGTFIYSITSRKIIDYIRRKTRNLKHVPEPFNSTDPHDDLEKKEREEIVYNAIKKLKPKHADILYMYYYLDVPRNQIAEIYSLSPRWISEIIKTARRSLKRIIEL